MKRLLLSGCGVMALFACFAGKTHAADVKVTLDDNAGASSFVVEDVDKVSQFKVNSNGLGFFGIGSTNIAGSLYKLEVQSAIGDGTSSGFAYTSQAYPETEISLLYGGESPGQDDYESIQFGHNDSSGRSHSRVTSIRTGNASTALAFLTGDTSLPYGAGKERMRITSAGNLGIGTATPHFKLDVLGGIGDRDTNNGIAYSLLGRPNIAISLLYGGILPNQQTGDYESIQFRHDDSSGSSFSRITSIRTGSASTALTFLTADRVQPYGTGKERMRITSCGKVGIGTNHPCYPLHMRSGAHVTAGGVWTDASSREYKENIRDLSVDEAMQALDELKPVRFNYKVDKGEEYVGFIAEDAPDLVATNDRKSLSPMDLQPC
ncbi:MAG: tail fiber domain-containing protein [Candidatus Brocadiaceae bacterium]